MIGDNYWAGQIPCPVWNPKARYHVLKSPPLDSVPSQTNPSHSLTVSSSTPRSSLQVVGENFICIFWLHKHIIIILLDFIILIMFGGKCQLWTLWLLSSLEPPVRFFHLGPIIMFIFGLRATTFHPWKPAVRINFWLCTMELV